MFGLFASTAATHADALEFFKPDRNNASVPLNPYGDGHSSNSPIIALGEAWAYHIGQYFTGLRYGNTSRCAGEQSICYGNGEIPGLNSHQIALENFDPNLSTDHFKWIPKGLFYDLLDPANETLLAGNPVNDYVSGYTNAQMFSTFQSNIYTLQDYRARLLQTVANTTSSQVTGLLTQYHY